MKNKKKNNLLPEGQFQVLQVVFLGSTRSSFQSRWCHYPPSLSSSSDPTCSGRPSRPPWSSWSASHPRIICCCCYCLCCCLWLICCYCCLWNCCSLDFHFCGGKTIIELTQCCEQVIAHDVIKIRRAQIVGKLVFTGALCATKYGHLIMICRCANLSK